MKLCNKAIKAPPLPQWKKHSGGFTYEITDPVAGGLWLYEAERKMSDEELLRDVLTVLFYGRSPRPKRGQVFLLRAHEAG